MAGSIFGKNFTITTWGESHGKAIGCVIDGCPSGIKLNEKYIHDYLSRRKPSLSLGSTSRKEADFPEILSGIFENTTIGTPISVVVKNTDAKSSSYKNIKNLYRPSHSDITYDKKYEKVDYRGGSRSSGRETIGRVIGGAIATKILKEFDIQIFSYVSSIGDINVTDVNESIINDLNIPNNDAYHKAKKILSELRKNGDSIGSSVTTIVKNCPFGFGEPVFRKLDALLSYAIMSIGGVKAIDIGCGHNASIMKGSQFNDSIITVNNNIKYTSNNSGGILGGISNSNDIVIKTYFKPTPSISITQDTIDKKGCLNKINISGRHDPVIAPRANVVVESMVSLTLVDLLFENTYSSINNIRRIYE